MKKPFLLILILFAAGCMADLRPPDTVGDDPQAAQQDRGRALLRRTAEFHGIAVAKRAATIQFDMTDHWTGLFARVIACPWPNLKTRFHTHYRLGSFDARTTFLDGDRKGHIWGMQAWKTYEVAPNGRAEFRKNEKAAFVLPAEQYLVELAFRAQDAEYVAYAGQEVMNGQTYDRVFMTWGSFSANSENDQYLLYLDPKSGRLEKGIFTVREKVKAFTSAVHFDNYIRVDGMLVPHTITLNGDIDGGTDAYLHQISIEPGSVQIGDDEGAFFVDKELPTIEDQKPSSNSG